MDDNLTLNTDEAYILIFREVNRAIEEINRFNYGIARDILISAQKEAEEIVISEK